MSKKNFFKGTRIPNTFIGNMGGTITTTTSLASKLSINSGQIHNFSIDSNNNISCYIGRNYSINESAFLSASALSYYIDLKGKCTALDGNVFHNALNPVIHKFLILPGVTTCVYDEFGGGGGGTRNKHNFICTPKLEPIGTSGSTTSGNYDHNDFDRNCYVAVSNQTSNGGAPDPDIASVVSGNIGSVVKYSSNSNIPPDVTGISTVTKDTVSIQISWDAISHSNSIDYYLVLVDGVYQTVTASTGYTITGLSTGTTYEIKMLAIDSHGNSTVNFTTYTETTN